MVEWSNRLSLLKNKIETLRPGIKVEEESAGDFGDGVPVGVDQDQGRGQHVEDFAHDGLHG